MIPKLTRNDVFDMSTKELYSLHNECTKLIKTIDCELYLRGDA